MLLSHERWYQPFSPLIIKFNNTTYKVSSMEAIFCFCIFLFPFPGEFLIQGEQKMVCPNKSFILMVWDGKLDSWACMTSWMQPAQTSSQQVHFLLSLSEQNSVSTKRSFSFLPLNTKKKRSFLRQNVTNVKTKYLKMAIIRWKSTS